MDGFLKRYGPRLGIFVLLLAAVASLVALRVYFKGRQSTDVGARMDQILDLPDASARIEPLRTLLKENPGCEAEPLLLNCLGNQLFQKAEGLEAAEATTLNREAAALFAQVYERFPDHPAAPQALYSAACCAEQLLQESEARRLYGDLQSNYPATFLIRELRIEGLGERMRAYREAFPDGFRPVVTPAPAPTEPPAVPPVTGETPAPAAPPPAAPKP